MTNDSGNLGGLLGAVIGFVIVAEGIRLIRSSERAAFRRNGYKIFPLSKLGKFKKSKSSIGNINIKLPNVRIRI